MIWCSYVDIIQTVMILNTCKVDCLFRIIVDETLCMMQHVAFHKLKDAGAVASSLAASIYGLDILAEDIQVFILSIYLSISSPCILMLHQLPILCSSIRMTLTM